MGSFITLILILLISFAIVAMNIWGSHLVQFSSFENAFLSIIFFQMGKLSLMSNSYRFNWFRRVALILNHMVFHLHDSLLCVYHLHLAILVHDHLHWFLQAHFYIRRKLISEGLTWKWNKKFHFIFEVVLRMASWRMLEENRKEWRSLW